MTKYPTIPGYSILARYVHGSEDSLDTDVVYIIDRMPDYNTCQDFCSSTEENRNLAVLRDGEIVECFKGAPDELNNGVFYTYNKHQQTDTLLIIHPVRRNIIAKEIGVVRCILSILSRTEYRQQIKKVLKEGNWTERLSVLNSIVLDDTILPLNKNGKSDIDLLKVIAFQIGQGLGLLEGHDLFTKKKISDKYPLLRPYLYRKNISLQDLNEMLHRYVDKLKEIEVEEDGENTLFVQSKRIFNVRKEEFVGWKLDPIKKNNWNF